MELIVVRHGLPIRVVTDDGSPADPPLSEEGRQQAERLGEWLGDEAIDRLYVSPMKRALHTAEPVAARLGIEPVVEPGVAEYDQASSTYIPIEEIKKNDPERWREMMRIGWFSDVDPKVFRQGVVETMERIIADNAGGRVLIVCHGGVINSWAAHTLGVEQMFIFNPGYTSISRFMCSSRGHRSVLSLNETGHLRPAQG